MTSLSKSIRTSFRGVFVVGPVLADDGLSASAKLIYATLMSFDGPNGCYPKLQQLADSLGTNISTIRRGIARLEAQGYIEVKRPQGKDVWQHKHTQYYFLPLDKTEHLAHARRVTKTHNRTSVQNDHSNDCTKSPIVTNIRSKEIRSIQGDTRASARSNPLDEDIETYLKEGEIKW